MHRVIIGVDQVVGGSGMIRMVTKDLFADGSGPHVERHIPSWVAHAKERQGVESLRLDILRVFRRQACHRPRVQGVALVLVTLPIERFHRSEPATFPLGLCLCPPGVRSGPEPGQRRNRLVPVLLLPDRVIVSHGLAPVGHGESGLDSFGLLE